MYQQTVIIGRLGRDCEMRFTNDGTPVSSMSVAVSRKWKDASGKEQEKTTWYKVTSWRKLAEVCGKFCRKGMMVLCVGEMQESKPWQASDGSYKSSLELTADTVRFLSKVEGADTGESTAGASIETEDLLF